MPSEQKMVSSGELAKILGKSERTVQMLAKSGMITSEKYKNRNVYNLYSVIQEYIENSAKSYGEEISSVDEAKTREEIRYKKAKADMMEIELNELDGRMHSADDVEAMTTDLVLAVRSSLLSLPGRLGVSVANMSSAVECSEVIKREVCMILDDLSKYSYSPEEYRKRMRERQGWATDIPDIEDE